MTTNLTRRRALAGAAALPLVPGAALGNSGGTGEIPQLATTVNATDAAWPEYLAAIAYAYSLENPDDDTLDIACDRLNAAEDAVFAAPVVTMLDVDRKLTVIANWQGAHIIEADRIAQVLGQVRQAAGGMS